jgi:hypothetical protein
VIVEPLDNLSKDELVNLLVEYTLRQTQRVLDHKDYTEEFYEGKALVREIQEELERRT